MPEPNPKATGRRTKMVGVRLLVFSGCLLLAMAMLEGYFRAQRTHIVNAKRKSFVDGAEVLGPDDIAIYGPDYKLLLPDIDVVIKNHFTSGDDVRLTTNRLGFRDDMPASPVPREDPKILFLGDSITMGDYLDADMIYVERVQQFMRRRFPRQRIHAINAGVGGVGLAEEIVLLKKRGLAIRPDVVVLAFYLNDSRPLFGFPQELGGKGWLRRHSVLADTLYRQWRLSRFIEGRPREQFAWIPLTDRLDWQSSREAFMELVDVASFDWGAAWDDASWDTIQKGMVELNRLSRQYQFELAVICFPVMFQVYARFVEDTPQRRLQRLVETMNIAYLDLLPVFRRHTDRLMFYDQCHLNEDGNEIAASAIADFISSRYPRLFRAQTPGG